MSMYVVFEYFFSIIVIYICLLKFRDSFYLNLRQLMSYWCCVLLLLCISQFVSSISECHNQWTKWAINLKPSLGKNMGLLDSSNTTTKVAEIRTTKKGARDTLVPQFIYYFSQSLKFKMLNYPLPSVLCITTQSIA
jgi:hypothetical protein